MALRAYIQSIDFPSDTDAHIVAVVTDDVRKKEIDLVVSSSDELTHRLRQVLGDVVNVDSLRTLKANDVIDLAVVSPDPPAGAAFYDAWGALQSELAKVDAGILAADDKRVSNARTLAAAGDDVAFRVGRR